jgi:citrate synthase
VLIESLAQVEEDGKTMEQVAIELAREMLGDPAMGVSGLMLKDPAARRIFARAESLGVAGEYIAFTEEIVKAAQQISEHPVDLDMLGAIGAAMMDLGFTPEATWAILAITRSFGAGAHYIEEVEREDLTRLGQELTSKENYDGPEDRPVPPLADRDRIAKPGQTHTPEEWKKALDERQKLHGSGFAIMEEIKDPSEKT